MGGFVGHPIPTVDIYAYGGAEGVDSKPYGTGRTVAATATRRPTSAGCSVELGSCSAVTSSIVEGDDRCVVEGYQVRLRHRADRAQYEWVDRFAFQGLGAKGTTAYPSANENMLLFSVRYLPFQ